MIARDRQKVLHMGLAAFGNAADAEDMAQDVFIRMWQRMEQGHTLDDTPSAWVMRVTINVIRDKMRTPWHGRATVDAEAGDSLSVPSAEDQILEGQAPYNNIVVQEAGTASALAGGGDKQSVLANPFCHQLNLVPLSLVGAAF